LILPIQKIGRNGMRAMSSNQLGKRRERHPTN